MNNKESAVSTIHSLLYKLISEHYRNRIDLEMKIGSDLSDQIWQIPYERLSLQLREKFDKLVEEVVSRIGTDNPFQILVLDAGLTDEEMNQLVSSWRYLEELNKSGEQDPLQEEGVVSNEELNEIMEQEHLLEACYIAFREIESRGWVLPSVIQPTVERLNRRFQNEQESN